MKAMNAWIGCISLARIMAVGYGSGAVPAWAQSTRAGVDGTFTTLDFPGTVSTACAGINNTEDIVGRFTDSAGKTYGFARVGTTFFGLAFRGANFTIGTGFFRIPNPNRAAGMPALSLNGW